MLKMVKENIKTDEPRIEIPDYKNLGGVFPERVAEMKQRSKEDRAKIAATELFPFNSKDVIAARQAQIDLGEDQEGREEAKSEKNPTKTSKKKQK